jgi:orotidine-5'-phosphate decarboxylase
VSSPSAVNRGQQFRDPTIPVRDRLIVALDLPTLERAEQVVRAFRPTVSWFKVGSELFTAAGPSAVAMVHSHGGRVFLDLKYHDIPTVVASAVAPAARLGVGMITVHLAGAIQGLRTITDALTRAGGTSGRPGTSRPWVLGVTRLTSIDGGGTSETVISAAQLALRTGFDGVVASARKLPQSNKTAERDLLLSRPVFGPREASRTISAGLLPRQRRWGQGWTTWSSVDQLWLLLTRVWP